MGLTPVCRTLVLALALAGCTRPLAEGERGFATALFGETLAADEVKVAKGVGLLPPPRRTGPPFDVDLDAADCERGEPKPVTAPPAAFVLYDRIHLAEPFYAGDTLLGWPEEIPTVPALVMAHEMAHVWQWQNRAETGYRPGRAASESLRAADPYFYGAGPPTRRFEDYGFEQQAALIEDYVCFSLLAPDDPRRRAIRTILDPVLPVERFDAALAGRS